MAMNLCLNEIIKLALTIMYQVDALVGDIFTEVVTLDSHEQAVVLKHLMDNYLSDLFSNVAAVNNELSVRVNSAEVVSPTSWDWNSETIQNADQSQTLTALFNPEFRKTVILKSCLFRENGESLREWVLNTDLPVILPMYFLACRIQPGTSFGFDKAMDTTLPEGPCQLFELVVTPQWHQHANKINSWLEHLARVAGTPDGAQVDDLNLSILPDITLSPVLENKRGDNI